jgi:hypothetical protein
MDAGVHSTPEVSKRRRADTIRMAPAVAFPQAWMVLAQSREVRPDLCPAPPKWG